MGYITLAVYERSVISRDWIHDDNGKLAIKYSNN